MVVRVSGTYAAKLKARAEVELRREELRMESAALKIQCRWRIKQGKMALHLKRQALAASASFDEEGMWHVTFDEESRSAYFYDTVSGTTQWDMPWHIAETGLHTADWVLCWDKRHAMPYYFSTADGTAHPHDDSQQFNAKHFSYFNPPPLARLSLPGKLHRISSHWL